MGLVGRCDLKKGEGHLGSQVTRDQPPLGTCSWRPRLQCPHLGLLPQAAAPCPWKCGGCSRDEATMEDTPPAPSLGSPLSKTLTLTGQPQILRRHLVEGCCCDHRACLAHPDTHSETWGSRAHRGAVTQRKQPWPVAAPKAHSCPSRWLCPGGGRTLPGSPHKGWSPRLASTPSKKPSSPQVQLCV